MFRLRTWVVIILLCLGLYAYTTHKLPAVSSIFYVNADDASFRFDANTCLSMNDRSYGQFKRYRDRLMSVSDVYYDNDVKTIGLNCAVLDKYINVQAAIDHNSTVFINNTVIDEMMSHKIRHRLEYDHCIQSEGFLYNPWVDHKCIRDDLAAMNIFGDYCYYGTVWLYYLVAALHILFYVWWFVKLIKNAVSWQTFLRFMASTLFFIGLFALMWINNVWLIAIQYIIIIWLFLRYPRQMLYLLVVLYLSALFNLNTVICLGDEPLRLSTSCAAEKILTIITFMYLFFIRDKKYVGVCDDPDESEHEIDNHSVHYHICALCKKGFSHVHQMTTYRHSHKWCPNPECEMYSADHQAF